jgi:hypothetical protein
MSEAVLQSMAFSNYQLSLDIRKRNMDPTTENFRSVFLSHNSQDNEFANRLAGDLSRNGVRVWIDEAEMKVGDSLIKSIQSAIKDMDFLAVILTPESVKSPWVEKELNVALAKEITGKRVRVLPILLRDCEIPIFLSEKVYADFRREELYYQSFGKILDVLKR